MKTRWTLGFALVMLALAFLACGGGEELSTSDADEPAPTATDTPLPPTATPTPTNTPIPPTPTPVTCESLGDRAATIPITLGETYSLQMPSSSGRYPGNCLYYCVGVPSGLDQLEIGVTDFSIDLNLYIGRGSIDVLSDVDVVEGSDWYSHHRVDGMDEDVSITNPQGDVYYIEVCSYDGRSGAFSLWTATSPSVVAPPPAPSPLGDAVVFPDGWLAEPTNQPLPEWIPGDMTDDAVQVVYITFEEDTEYPASGNAFVFEYASEQAAQAHYDSWIAYINTEDAFPGQRGEEHEPTRGGLEYLRTWSMPGVDPVETFTLTQYTSLLCRSVTVYEFVTLTGSGDAVSTTVVSPDEMSDLVNTTAEGLRALVCD
jgi:hypothetical protein